MSNTRYLEFDSTYRNRNEWPLASEFQIPISQSGRKNISNALDPVSLATPIMAWTCNYLDKSDPTMNTITLSGTLLFNSSPLVSYTSDNQTFVIKTDPNSLQQLENYYVGLVITTAGTVVSRRRIIGYKYLSNNGSNDFGLVTIASSFPEGVLNNDAFTINDPTDLTDTTNPYFFVPSGRIQKNGYTGYLLYNETLRQYRPILEYDFTTHLISLNTSGSTTSTTRSGPVTSWLPINNYSIRKQTPYLPVVGSSALTSSSFTNNSLIIAGGLLPPTSSNFYKNYAIRIIPDPSSEKYDYINNSATIANPTPPPDYFPTNQSRTIISSSYDSGTTDTTLNFYPSIDTTATAIFLEILNFSYDNFNPFTYTGSLVSQQDMVCYEVELLNLILPNEVLAVGEGGRIAFYPYVYVQLSNVSSACGGLSNIIYSNNPNAIRAIFRVPIDDVINPIISTYVKVDGDGMVQTIKFKPNDNLYFSVFLANGELYKTILPEYYSPAQPNPSSQISVCFSIRRL